MIKEKMMKLFHVEPNCYGTYGAFVIAETEERAKELFLKKYPEYSRDELSVEFQCEAGNEFVGEDLIT